MTKKITAIFLALCMAIPVLPMTIQAHQSPILKLATMLKWARITMPQFFGDV